MRVITPQTLLLAFQACAREAARQPEPLHRRPKLCVIVAELAADGGEVVFGNPRTRR